MTTLLILATGLAIVIFGILVLRLHAFVALILAGLTVALLTPDRLVSRSVVMQTAVRHARLGEQGRELITDEPLPGSGPWEVMIDQGPDEDLQRVGLVSGDDANVSQFDGEEEPGAVFYTHPFSLDSSTPGQMLQRLQNPKAELIVVGENALLAGQSVAGSSFVSRVTTSLGEYCGKLAILIVAASIIGRCLLDSGAADRIVRWSLDLVGEDKAPVAFVFSGFTLAIPVFFDTVFLLMIPLGRALRRRTGKNYLLYVLSIVVGGTMAHSLVPPTPGPLFVMEAFGVSFPQMLLGGMLVGLFSATVGLSFSYWLNRRNELPLRDNDSAVQTEIAETSVVVDDRAPSLLLSLLPIVLPVALITTDALVKQAAGAAEPWMIAGWNFSAWLVTSPAGIQTRIVVGILGEKNLALLISAIIAVLMFVMTRRPSKDRLSTSLQSAVTSAGTIILVTAAGGAFGRMMNQTSVAELLQNLPDTSPIMVVVAAFLVTTAVRTAQGSATVAMITSAGIFGTLVTSGAAGVHPLYVALAVGCGSKPVAWMNDSGFWVITKMSGMTEAEGLKYVTPTTTLAGIAGLVAIIVGMSVFPMV